MPSQEPGFIPPEVAGAIGDHFREMLFGTTSDYLRAEREYVQVFERWISTTVEHERSHPRPWSTRISWDRYVEEHSGLDAEVLSRLRTLRSDWIGGAGNLPTQELETLRNFSISTLPDRVDDRNAVLLDSEAAHRAMVQRFNDEIGLQAPRWSEPEDT